MTITLTNLFLNSKSTTFICASSLIMHLHCHSNQIHSYLELEERIRIRSLYNIKDSNEENTARILIIRTRYTIHYVLKIKYLNELML